MPRTRRQVLCGLTGLVVGLPGCSSVLSRDDEPTDTPRYHYLKQQRTYTGPEFDIDISPYTTIVSDPRDSDVALLSRKTTRPGDTIVEWLLAGVAVGLYGAFAKSRLFNLLEGTDAEDHFGGEFVVGSGPADLMVMYPVPEEDRLIPLTADFADVRSGRTVIESNRARSIAEDLGPFLKTADSHS